jgi:hypothetical protein
MQRMNVGNRRSTERLAAEKSVINGIVHCRPLFFSLQRETREKLRIKKKNTKINVNSLNLLGY